MGQRRCGPLLPAASTKGPLPRLCRAAVLVAAALLVTHLPPSASSLCFFAGRGGPAARPTAAVAVGRRWAAPRRKRGRTSRRFWPLQLPFLGGGGSAAEASLELQRLLREAAASGEEPDRARADALIDELAAARVPFDANFFGGGLWKAIYTRGETPKWERNARLLPFLRNVAGQDYDPAAGRVVNYGEVLGTNMYFKAEGSFSEVDVGVRSCPKDYDVFVERGGISLLGVEIPLPISGKGYLRCLYADAGLRIFVSPRSSPDNWEDSGLIVVQMPMASLEPDWKPPYQQQVDAEVVESLPA